METSGTRNYKCKDEELPVIGRNAMSCLKRDLADFTAFSPVFNTDYVNLFTAKINKVDELVSPKTETNELKQITKRLYQTIDSLLDPIAKIRGYLNLAKNLLLVISNLKKYREPLTVVGLNDSIIEQLNAAVTSITDDNQQQFNIVGKRKTIVQANVNVMNDLYAQLIEFLNIGKTLYAKTNPLKSKEYTFNSLKKSVR
jgi:hypothetical protein